MMTLKIEQYQRKSYDVDVVQVTEENMEEVAKWCQGDVRTLKSRGEEKRYVKVRVFQPKGERQTQAFVGDRVLYAGTGYKVFTENAFQRSFEPKVNVSA